MKHLYTALLGLLLAVASVTITATEWVDNVEYTEAEKVLLLKLEKSGALSPLYNSPASVIASKCRLRLPVNIEHCRAVGVAHTKGGMLKGLPEVERTTGKDSIRYLKENNWM